LNYADRVQETTTTSGVGTVVLAGAVAGYRTYNSIIPKGIQVANCFVDGTAWEVSYGTVGATSLTRDILIASSTGSFLNLSGGSTIVFLTAPAPQIDWPTEAKSIENGDILNIPTGRRLTTSIDMTILGILNCYGDLIIL